MTRTQIYLTENRQARLRESATVGFVQTHEQEITLSAVTVAELFAGVREGEEKLKLDQFVDLFAVMPIDQESQQPDSIEGISVLPTTPG